ncbi:hypothetical protein AN619_23210 [Thermotalea metallivorans]|uniref:Integrase catalytic domain-containing protein n=1 Tax=Thermotalea metallivorans TaxID=520762 RepID=A0A140L1S5_9FIRM|nr:hypothetical protein AN619_23210 [Thermotalea metallivorans]
MIKNNSHKYSVSALCRVLQVSRSTYYYFKNKIIGETLETFNIKRSLSMKGCPYDNAVAEATFKVIKTEFVKRHVFGSLDELQLELWDYVNWFNNHRIHSSLGYLTPCEHKLNHLKKVV